MHSLGFWHEHSRIDRDDHIRIKWENILPGMKSQFDVISGALQDTLGENYDYRSIMHYDSTAFSKNGQNTIETMVDGFTGIIGSATDLSELDIVKISKLYKCNKKDDKSTSTVSSKKATTPTIKINEDEEETTIKTSTTSIKKQNVPTTPEPEIIPFPESTDISKTSEFSDEFEVTLISFLDNSSGNTCNDHFLDCPNFKEYCKKVSFFFVMKAYCPLTCNHCGKQQKQ